MSNINAVFIGAEEVKVKFTHTSWAYIDVEAEGLACTEFEETYIPSSMKLDDFILYIIYDHNLVKDHNGRYLHKVIYTDLYNNV